MGCFRVLVVFLCTGLYSLTWSQSLLEERYADNIFLFMEETQLPIDEIKKIGEEYFKVHGTERGSGYKQFQRWLYERQFHLDEGGYLIDPNLEDEEYARFVEGTRGSRIVAAPWTELGPTSWSYTSGWNPGVGRVTSVAVRESDMNTIYIASAGGGIWKSTNAGSSWIPLTDMSNSSWLRIYHITIDPSNANILYAAVMGGGVIKSTNAGTSWTSTGSGPSTTRKVVVHPTNSTIVFATASNGIYRSTNSGTSWTQVDAFNCEDLEFKPGDPNIVYVSGTSDMIKRSTNGGVNWTSIGSAQGITNSGRTLLGVSPANPGVVYAVQASGSIFGRMYKSTDSGQTFITTVIGNSSNGTNYFGYNSDGTGTTGQATYDMAICVNPIDADEVHIAGIICWKSTNGGFAFTVETVWSYPNSTGYNHADVHALEWVGSVIFSGSDGGIYKSTNNGGDWTDLTAGIGIRQLYRMSNAKTNANIIVTGAQDNGSSYRTSAGVWTDWLGADGMDNMISPTNPNIAFGTSQNGQLYKTTNGGASYSGINEPADGNWVTPVAMDPSNHSIIYAGWTDVYKSTNSGSAWTNISNQYINRKLDVLVLAPSNTNFIYAAATNKIFRTQDGGTTWDSIAMAQNVTSIFVSATNPQKIWVTINATSNHVLYSTNMGTTMQSISAGLPALTARSVVVDESMLNGVYVGLNIGVYYRNDITTAWTAYNDLLPLVAINELEIHQGSGKIRVATYGRGVWENALKVPPCSSHVIYTLDDGLGTLRSAIGCTTSSDTITFASSLNGQFIDLASGPITINRNIKLLQTSSTVMKIRSLGGGPIFTLNPGKSATLRYIDLYSGNGQVARAILNYGDMALNQVTLFDNATGSGTLIENKGTMTVNGVVNVKN